MANQMHHLNDEKKFTALIVAYYIYFLQRINAHYGHESKGPGFIPSLFLKSHIALKVFYKKLFYSFLKCGFHPYIVDVTNINFSSTQELNHQLLNPLLTAASHSKKLRFGILLHRLRHFFIEHFGKVILTIVIAAFIIDFYYIDVTDPHAMKKFFQHGSIFIVVLGLFTKIFGSLIPKILTSVMSFKQTENIFQNRYWRRLISKLNHSFTPLVLMFDQMEALEDEKLLITLQVIQSLRSSGIICIAAGSNELLSATINSKQTRLTAEFILDAYAGVNYGDMLLAVTFNLNVFFHKHYINIQKNEQAIIDTDLLDKSILPETSGDEDTPHKIPKAIEEITFLDNHQLKKAIEIILDPFTQYLHLNQESIMGLIESLRLYATLLGASDEDKLSALLVFIIASKYDRAWLKATSYSILTASDSPKSEDSEEETVVVPSSFMLDQNQTISTLFKTTLANAKDIIDACYGLSGQLKISPNGENHF